MFFQSRLGNRRTTWTATLLQRQKLKMATDKLDEDVREDPKFPCVLTLNIPFPSADLARTALLALSVDAELSPLVHRSFAISEAKAAVLTVHYSATTNRMLRVAVNGFFESVGVVIGVMKDLDVDVVDRDMEGGEALEGVQGLEPLKR